MSCCNNENCSWYGKFRGLQYRKRYELLQRSEPQKTIRIILGYNTASGMSCCNGRHGLRCWRCHYVTIPQAVWAVATAMNVTNWHKKRTCYNTASGMSCCNFGSAIPKEYKDFGYNTASGMSCCNILCVTLVAIVNGYNTASGMSCCNIFSYIHRNHESMLQYRKRYELLQLLQSLLVH